MAAASKNTLLSPKPNRSDMTPMQASEVFTPRNAYVNLRMYVSRLPLETALLASVQGSMHSLIFGESGNGKSWLYKKVFDEHKIPYAVANCASASRNKSSLTDEIRSALIPDGNEAKTGYSEKKEASANAVFASGKLEYQAQYAIKQPDPLLEALGAFNRLHGGRRCVLVIDNLESIFKHPTLLDELADIIIVLDDSKFSDCNIKLLIVGIPNAVLDYFAQIKNMEAVANRIEELPKVGSLSRSMVHWFVNTGFNKLLNYNLSDDDTNTISRHVHHVTMGVAQRVHEYCEKLAQALESSDRCFAPSVLKQADLAWLTIGLRLSYTIIELHLNSKKATISRRNQVIYCIGHMDMHQFDSSDVRAALIGKFPRTANENNMGIGAILNELTLGPNPLLTKHPRTNQYRVADPRHLMCIRVALWIDSETQAVSKGNFLI